MAKHKDSKETWLCKSCGCNLLRRPQEYRKGDCGKCFQAKKKQAASDLLLRPCKTCGKPIGSKDKRQVVCSKECGHKGRTQEKVLVACCVCGKEIERYKSRLAIRDEFACSLICQRQHSLEDNRGRRGGEPDWSSRSANAKNQWKDKYRMKRLKKYATVRAKLGRIANKRRAFKQLSTEDGAWLYRIKLRIGEHKHRKKRGEFSIAAPGCIGAAIRKLAAERQRASVDPWKVRITQKLSGIRKRRRRKNESNNNRSSNIQKAAAKPVQMCFDWMGH